MAKFGNVPIEVPACRTSVGSAPLFVAAVEAILRDLDGVVLVKPFEWLRTPERQSFLHGFGRKYDDGRGSVTNAETSLFSWHGFGLAVDIVEKDATPWDAPPMFWKLLGATAEKHGLAWGGRWKKPDLPHVQWGKCPASPTGEDRLTFLADGYEAVWKKYGAA